MFTINPPYLARTHPKDLASESLAQPSGEPDMLEGYWRALSEPTIFRMTHGGTFLHSAFARAVGSVGRAPCLSQRTLGRSVLSISEEVKHWGPQRPSGGGIPGTPPSFLLLPSLLRPLTTPPSPDSLPSLPFCSPPSASLSCFSPISILKATHNHQEKFLQSVACIWN